MTEALHMEVRKHAIRQTQDGWVVSFVVHPNDIDSTFAVAPLGTRYMLAIAQIGDDERIINVQAVAAKSDNEQTIRTAPGPTRAVAPDNGAYQAPLGTRRALVDHTGKGGNPASDPDMAAARTRAVMLCKDRRFQQYLGNTRDMGPGGAAERHSAAWVRFQCDVDSRSEIATNHDAYMRFLALEGRYRVATGLTAEQRG